MGPTTACPSDPDHSVIHDNEAYPATVEESGYPEHSQWFGCGLVHAWQKIVNLANPCGDKMYAQVLGSTMSIHISNGHILGIAAR